MEPQGDIALIGLAVMGQNLILNMNDHGFTVVAYNRTTEKVDHFLANEAKGTKVLGAHSIEEMVSKLKKPRRVMMLVKAGKPVDEFIEQLIPHLEPGDIIIDGGNSLFEDTNRRVKYVESKGLLYVGTGVSGGEEGARRGPSIMPGGSPAAWPHVKDIFQARFREGRRRCSLLRLGRRRRRGPLCEDGSQRHRIRRHAVDLRSLQHHEKRPRHERRRNARGFRRMEHRRTGFLSHRNFARHSRLQGHGRHAARGQNSRHRRPERHRQMDGHQFRRISASRSRSWPRRFIPAAFRR